MQHFAKPARVFTSAFLYFCAGLFSGTCLGIVRNLLLAPKIGALQAVLVELPIILTVCWFALKAIINSKIGRDLNFRDLLLMGTLAFAFLIFGEIILGRHFIQLPLIEILNSWTTIEGVVGLTGQLIFGLFPAIHCLKSGKITSRKR